MYSGLRCSFCGKTEREVSRLIAGPGVYICSDCIDLCNLLLEDTSAPDYALSPVRDPESLMTPQEIKEALDEDVYKRQLQRRCCL